MEAAVRLPRHHEATVVALAGELDVVDADSLRHRLVVLVETGHTHLVVDLTGVTFMDSTGLGVLVGARRRVGDRGGRLVLVVDQEPLRKVLRVSALTQVFPLHRTLEGALADA